MWDKASLRARGLNCSGPQPLNSMVLKEKCSRGVKINFDTALVLVREYQLTSRKYLTLSTRCVECHSESRVLQMLKDLDLLREDGQEVAICANKGCDKEATYMSKLCVTDMLEIARTIPNKGLTAEAKADISKGVNKSITSGTRWKLDELSGFKMFLNRKATGARIFAFDLEGNLQRNNMTQVAVILADDSEVLFNLSISDPQAAPHQKFQDESDIFLSLDEAINSRFTAFVPRKSSGDVKIRAEAAGIMKNFGIRSTDYLLVWHRRHQDWICLRHNLVAELGEKEVAKFFPPKENVIRVNWFFKHNLGSTVYCGLEYLFKAYFPNDDLNITHHDAEIDTLKLIRMAHLGEMFYRGEAAKIAKGNIFDRAKKKASKDSSV